MQLLAISLNYKKVPVAVREQFSFNDEELAAAMADLKNEPSILENVIISTCNRTEIYVVVDQLRRGEDYVKRFLATRFGFSTGGFKGILEVYPEFEAAKHLFRVTCGLESLVVGEEQILAQVKASFAFAQENQATGSLLNHLFNEAIALSKRVHTQTELSRNSVSIGTAAVALAKQEGFDFSGKKALVIGAGDMSELSAKHLAVQGLESLTIANRTLGNAEKLAQTYGAKAVGLEKLSEHLSEVDIVLSSTSAKGFVLKREHIKARQKPLYLFDLAVPRDMEPELGDDENIRLYSIDDLRRLLDKNIQARDAAVAEAEQMIAEDLAAFISWFQSLAALPIIAKLQERSMAIHSEVYANIEQRLPELTEHERKVIHKLTRSIVNQLLREPILEVKEIAQNEENAALKLEEFERIFGLK